MGKQLLDQYSLLHYGSGIMAYHLGLEPLLWFLSHAAFEFVENTEGGMNFITSI